MVAIEPGDDERSGSGGLDHLGEGDGEPDGSSQAHGEVLVEVLIDHPGNGRLVDVRRRPVARRFHPPVVGGPRRGAPESSVVMVLEIRIRGMDTGIV